MKVRGEGPIPTRIMLVGEAPSEREEALGLPFQGASGQELNKMLQEVGIMRSECYTTNVLKIRPPNNQLSAFIASTKKEALDKKYSLLRDKYVTKEVIDGYNELLAEIEMVQPNLIIAFGNLAMWALTGNWGILKWRGSLLETDILANSGIDVQANRRRVIPTIHPAAILREWGFRAIVLNDLRRAKTHMKSKGPYENTPNWQFSIRPSYTDVGLYLWSLLNALDAPATNWDYWIDLDIETRNNFIACVGLSFSRTEAMCIPFMVRGTKEGYWGEEQEAWIVYMLYRILTHPKVKVRWQNGLFDAQLIHKHWHFIPRHGQDTMIAHHSCFAAQPKALAFLASMYCDFYQFWKEDK